MLFYRRDVWIAKHDSVPGLLCCSDSEGVEALDMKNKISISKCVNTGDGVLKVKSKVINQVSLTSDCWLVQFWGLSACKNCELEGKDDCGGRKILAKIKAGKYASTGLPDLSYPKGG